MGSEIFRLKSLSLKDTIARGARIGFQNARTTNTIVVNSLDEDDIKTGEENVNKEYLIQSSLSSNNQKGFGTFTEESSIVSGYTGPQDIKHNDEIRLDYDLSFYTATGIQGTDVYLTEPYKKENDSDPDVQKGVCTVRKNKLGNVKYEYIESEEDKNIIHYDKNENRWGYTGIQPSGPEIAEPEEVSFDTGLKIRFSKSSQASAADLKTVGTIRKTIVDNNAIEVSNVSLSPVPYPHESLKVYIGASDGEPELKEEFKDYTVNYSQNPQFQYPYPAFEDREVAYIKFLKSIVDEIQVKSIDQNFQGVFALSRKETVQGVENVDRQIQDIIPDTDSLKVGDQSLEKNFEYTIDYSAGIVTSIEHRISENLIESISYPKRLIWDGISFIRGKSKNDVKNFDNLVIPPVSGLQGINEDTYFEDTDEDNLIRDVDYVLELESGSFQFERKLNEGDAILASYYVEGQDEENEILSLDVLRTNKYPILGDSITLTKKWRRTDEGGNVKTGTRILIEGQDFTISYLTGKIILIEQKGLSLNEETISLKISYTPLSQVNCVIQPDLENTDLYRLRIIDDILEIKNSEDLIFGISNQYVSIPQENSFLKKGDENKYTFTGSILENGLKSFSVRERPEEKYTTENYGYTDITKELQLDTELNENRPEDEDTILASYEFESESLPYAPIQAIFLQIEEGSNQFKIEGFDRTDSLKKESILRIDNFDPEEIHYVKIKDVVFKDSDTYVTIYGTFSNTIFNPTFYVFDSSIKWENLPQDTLIDRSSLQGSQSIRLRNNVNEISDSIRPGTILQINGSDIYNTRSVEVANGIAEISIFPSLKDKITGDIVYSHLPINSEGDDIIDPRYAVLLDPQEPAFKISYNSPSGFEGSGKAFITNEEIVLYESISGIPNPVPYRFPISEYSSIKDISDAIRDTNSTYNQNVTIINNIPTYKPFAIDYYLPSGERGADTIISSEEESPSDLPQTITILPELFKWDIIEYKKEENFFCIPEVDKTSEFLPGSLLSLRERSDNTFYFFEISQSEFLDDKNPRTEIRIKDNFRENYTDADIYTYVNPIFKNLSFIVSNIDLEKSRIMFFGDAPADIEIGAVLKIEDKYIYRIEDIDTDIDTFTLTVSPDLDNRVRMENYEGYIKYTENLISFDSNDSSSWKNLGSQINIRLLELDSDYTIDTGAITLSNPLQNFERLKFNYMGQDNLVGYSGESIKASCTFFYTLPAGSRLDVQIDYLNVDQFYLQKLTERNFTEIVVVPQIEELLYQKGGGGGQGSDTAPTQEDTPPYEGGLVNDYYRIVDEYIKKQLYLRFFNWYKERLRAFSAELQLISGFKFGNSTAVGKTNGSYSLEDQYVENHEYTLTSDEDIEQIDNQFSKFFPVGYDGSAPAYYNRFSKEYFNAEEVYCCNIKYIDNNNQPKTIGIVKGDSPYWSRDLDFVCMEDQYITNNLVGNFIVTIPREDRTFKSDTYTFLKRIDRGDNILVDGTRGYHSIEEIVAPNEKDYEYLILDRPFQTRDIRTFDLEYLRSKYPQEDLTFNTLIDKLSSSGYNIWVRREQGEDFPMFDDSHSLGATAQGRKISGHKTDTSKIKKPFFANLLEFLTGILPGAERTEIFEIEVKKDPDASWEPIGSIDISKLNFKEEQDVDDIMDALRYDFTEKFTIPAIPPSQPTPVPFYEIKQDPNKGFHRFFYFSFEKVYDKDRSKGYYEAITIRAKNRNWWLRIRDAGESPIVEDYGFNESLEYENFYDSDNLYRKYLREKQAWETESLILKDLYDHNDKIARAFDQGFLNKVNSVYRDYLAKQEESPKDGISDILMDRISATLPQLSFLVSSQGPLSKIIKPDGIHDEDEATNAIKNSYEEAVKALSIYQGSYGKSIFYRNLNNENNVTWRNDYIRWVLSLQEGIIYQKNARDLYNNNASTLNIGLKEIEAISFKIMNSSIVSATIKVSEDSNGKFISISFDAQENAIISSHEVTFLCYKIEELEGVNYVVYRSLNDIIQEINNYDFEDKNAFKAKNIFDHYENNITKNILEGTWQIDPSSSFTFYVTSVADHRDSDPRILFLSRNIEDRIYTQNIRELPALQLDYLGNLYSQARDAAAIEIKADFYLSPDPGFRELSFTVKLDENLRKIFVVRGRYVRAGIPYQEVDFSNTFNLFDEELQGYITIGNLVDNINNFVFEGKNVFEAQSVYDQGDSLSTSYLQTNENFVDADRDVFQIENSWTIDLYVHIETSFDDLEEELNRARYRIFYDTDTHKKLEVRFAALKKDGNNIIPDIEEEDTVFLFDFQKTESEFKTLQEFSTEIIRFKYKMQNIFSMRSVYQKDPEENLSTRYIVAEDRYYLLGADSSATLYADIFLDTTEFDSDNERDTSKVQAAYFSFPFYTANGNPAKAAIENIPVSGRWSEVAGEDVIRIEILDDADWEVSYSDFSEGDYKYYSAPQDILDQIDTQGAITQSQFDTIKNTVQLDQPIVTIVKYLVLKRKGINGEEQVLSLNLRKNPTINDLVTAINTTRFNEGGEIDASGDVQYWSAELLGDSSVQGRYKSYEIEASYTPVVRNFYVIKEDDSENYMTNQLVGWELSTEEIDPGDPFNVTMGSKRYSYGPEYDFRVDPPDLAQDRAQNNFPQGFRTDITAFDLYCWDEENSQGERFYEIKDNWIYFRSANVEYKLSGDYGQPDKKLGYGIPLAGSGHSEAPENETIKDLVERINNNTVVNRWFYANLKFTRDHNTDPGYFQYGYLPDFRSDVEKSSLDSFNLKNDDVITLAAGDGFNFTSSSYTVDSTSSLLSMSCTYEYEYTYQKVYNFNSPNNDTISQLTNNINGDLAPEFSNSVFEAQVITVHGPDDTEDLEEVTPETSISDSFINLSNQSSTDVMKLKVRTIAGGFFSISDATYEIPSGSTRMILRCKITYSNTYNLVNHDFSSETLGELSEFINSIRDLSDPVFPSLFNSSLTNNFYGNKPASFLLDDSGSINGQIELESDLSYLIGLNVLNMDEQRPVMVSSEGFIVESTDIAVRHPSDKDLHDWIDGALKGDYNEGLLSINMLPIKISTTTYGILADVEDYTLSENTPAPVYFGIMGDIRFVQISDKNLHTQLNYVKERLGQPWKDNQGVIQPDYYTPEFFNQNNPFAIDFENFLKFIRIERYNQIKDSVVNEGLVQNKYFWLYMKFHKEFGCDQRAIALKKQIEKKEEDSEIIGTIE